MFKCVIFSKVQIFISLSPGLKLSENKSNKNFYRLTNWLMFLCWQIQSPRPDVMPDRREGIARAEGFLAARTETSPSQ